MTESRFRAKLVFLRRTEKEIQVFGGDVYIDVDGKNVGILSRANQEYIIQAEQPIILGKDETLVVKYSCPMMMN